ncbi:N-formylglutamate amidohydrolase [Pelagibius litoralis]|uniref:N-formylglutamate amidohydrolase n=1 Tax=Pelagibius litoralis TaxID=374515 RepID=A0A967C5E6_9PROT|nr:N-formylglutamate amidohydrolase [Pelagibius litoralis]NIA69069.1 N-formylglutamate amidohydrolase [Pelagibius litoralis]
MDAIAPSARASQFHPASQPHEILWPEQQSLPLVFASPHSGCDYPPAFLAASRLDPVSLRQSEDSFVNEIFGCAPEMGAPLIHALFPRAFVDPNREPYELDPAVFKDKLPAYANTRSPRVAAGLGTIARVVANGANIYKDKLSLEEGLERIRTCYWPYHEALRSLVEQTKERFGYCILVDCHSMPSLGKLGQGRCATNRIAFVLGDCHGTSCNAAVTSSVERTLMGKNYQVVRNSPYAGGFVTRHYGRPEANVHSLQIEINRQIYMDETRMERRPALNALAQDMRDVVAALGAVDPGRRRNGQR